MLPYFIAVGHHQYAKRTRMSLELFDAWIQQCPKLMDEVFGKDHHRVRFSLRNSTGTRSDMSIEESVMREAKTSGGIVELETLIFCNCIAGDCSRNNCSCFKNNVKCVSWQAITLTLNLSSLFITF